jgi:hypothetical protein
MSRSHRYVKFGRTEVRLSLTNEDRQHDLNEVTFTLSQGAWTFQDYATPEQARELAEGLNEWATRAEVLAARTAAVAEAAAEAEARVEKIRARAAGEAEDSAA